MQFGFTGPITISAFAAATIASVWLAAWGAAKLAQKHPLLAGLFASSGVRIVAPFTIALVVVLSRGQIAPIELVYYLVPLYLCMLVADIVVWVREVRKRGPLATGSHANGSFASREVV